MKKLHMIALLAIICLFTTSSAFAGSTVEYFGSKSGLFRPCKGDAIRVCKRITTDLVKIPDFPKFEDQLDPSDFPKFELYPGTGKGEIMPMSMENQEDEESVIVEYDGVEYQVPISWINFEDGSITPQ